jgi:hypothetical protein
LISLAFPHFSPFDVRGRGLARFGHFLPQKGKTVSDAVSDLKQRKGLKNQGKMVLTLGIEPISSLVNCPQTGCATTLLLTKQHVEFLLVGQRLD